MTGPFLFLTFVFISVVVISCFRKGSCPDCGIFKACPKCAAQWEDKK